MIIYQSFVFLLVRERRVGVNPFVIAANIREQGILACLVTHRAQPKANDAREHPTELARNLHDVTASAVAQTHVPDILYLKGTQRYEFENSTAMT